MRYSLAILILSTILFSCNKDDDSSSSSARALIGEWEASTFIIGSTDYASLYDALYLEFEQDNTFEWIAESWLTGRDVGLGTWSATRDMLRITFNSDAFTFCDELDHTFNYHISGRSSVDEELNLSGTCEKKSLKAELFRQ